MPTLDNNFIEELITCLKHIVEAPKSQMKVDGRQLRNRMKLRSETGARFEVFVRQLIEFPEDFSVGLIYLPQEGGRKVLLRVNGDHGYHQNKIIDNAVFIGPHVHKATEAAQVLGFNLVHWAYAADEYHSLEEALPYFGRLVNIQGIEKFWKLPDGANQLALFKDEAYVS